MANGDGKCEFDSKENTWTCTILKPLFNGAVPTGTQFVFTKGRRKPRLCLVNKEDPNRCLFSVLELRAGAQNVPLRLVNHPGIAIPKVFDDARDLREWK